MLCRGTSRALATPIQCKKKVSSYEKQTTRLCTLSCSARNAIFTPFKSWCSCWKPYWSWCHGFASQLASNKNYAWKTDKPPCFFCGLWLCSCIIVVSALSYLSFGATQQPPWSFIEVPTFLLCAGCIPLMVLNNGWLLHGAGLTSLASWSHCNYLFFLLLSSDS